MSRGIFIADINANDTSGEVSLDVKGEVVRPGESSAADVALEGLHARVFPLVPGQLVRPGEPPPAAGPPAHVGLLPRVGPDVGLQVAGLDVVLAAPLEGAGEDLLVLLEGVGGVVGFDFLFDITSRVTCDNGLTARSSISSVVSVLFQKFLAWFLLQFFQLLL